jgi:hypothetical protein
MNSIVQAIERTINIVVNDKVDLRCASEGGQYEIVVNSNVKGKIDLLSIIDDYRTESWETTVKEIVSFILNEYVEPK